MSIEQSLASIAKSLEILAATAVAHTDPTVSVAAPVAPVAPVVAPVGNVPAPTPPVQQQVTPPSVPAFTAPVSASPSNVPKTIGELQAYVMGTYKTLGPEKGAAIQTIIAACGVANINEINPTHFGYVFEQVERLKVA